MTLEQIESMRLKLEAAECKPDEKMVWVGMEYHDDPTTRHFSRAARQILNQIPCFQKHLKETP